jgi:hypothetical protein
MELRIAEWGDPDWMDEAAAAELAMAYVRRKRVEARLIAVEVGRLLGGGAGEKGKQASMAQLASWGIGVQ